MIVRDSKFQHVPREDLRIAVFYNLHVTIFREFVNYCCLPSMAMPVDQKLLRQTKFPVEFNQKVDIQKVNVEVLKK